VSKTRDLVFVKGDLQLKNQGLCRLDNIFPDMDIAVGDTIETSGLGGIYPKGIIIGKVRKSDVKPMISTGMQLLSLPLILNGLKKCLCWKAKIIKIIMKK